MLVPQTSTLGKIIFHVINEIVKSSSFSHHHNHHVFKLISLSNVDRWKERYIVVTRDYLQCYKRVATEASQMGPFLNQVLRILLILMVLVGEKWSANETIKTKRCLEAWTSIVVVIKIYFTNHLRILFFFRKRILLIFYE